MGKFLGLHIAAVFGAVGLATVIGADARAEQVVLEPSSDWTLDYGEESCSLVRDFGPPDERIGLRLDSYGSKDYFVALLIGDGVPRIRDAVIPIRFQLPLDTVKRRQGAITGKIGESRFVQSSLNFRPYVYAESRGTPAFRLDDRMLADQAVPEKIDETFEAATDWIWVEFKRGNEVKLATGPMAPALDALRGCIDDLYASWGIDPETQRQLSRQAFPRADAIQTVLRDFPTNMAFKGTNGFLPVRLAIDANGNPGECIVQLPNVPEDYIKTVCDNIGSEFFPALDSDGAPVDSMYQINVTFTVR